MCLPKSKGRGKVKIFFLITSDEPELEFSGSSRAELGHFDFRAETELTSDSMYVKKSQKYIENLLILDFFHN